MPRYGTPLRYPGGKQKLTAFVIELLEENNLIGGHYAEPFAGGAGIAIELLVGKFVSHIHLNDLAKPVYAFWRAILRKPEEFCRRIASASLTPEEWKRQREIFKHPSRHCQLDVGFSLFYLCRCNRSGIPTAGLIGGLNQQGHWKMDARFPRNELIRRVEIIAERKKHITVKNMDANVFIKDYIPTLPQKSLVYCDPPYYGKGHRLYANYYKAEDHIKLAQTIQGHIRKPWIVSYDCVPQVLEQYSSRRSFQYALQYNAARAYKGTELFFFADKMKIPQTSSIKSINVALRKIPA